MATPAQVTLIGNTQAYLNVRAAVLQHFWLVETVALDTGEVPKCLGELVVVCASLPSEERQAWVERSRAEKAKVLIVRMDAYDAGPLAGAEFHGAYSWAAFFFRFSVHERGFFRPEEAIRRLTGVPAKILGLGNRGVLATGNYADIAVFDPACFGETTTTYEPNSLARGMRYVLVNGRLALDDGRLTAERAGRVVRRGGR